MTCFVGYAYLRKRKHLLDEWCKNWSVSRLIDTAGIPLLDYRILHDTTNNILNSSFRLKYPYKADSVTYYGFCFYFVFIYSEMRETWDDLHNEKANTSISYRLPADRYQWSYRLYFGHNAHIVFSILPDQINAFS